MFLWDRVILIFYNNDINNLNADILKNMKKEMDVFNLIDTADVNETEKSCDKLLIKYL